MDYYEILRIIENIAGNGRSKVLWKPYGDWLGECIESAERQWWYGSETGSAALHREY